jgi:hypothetical protein
MKKIITFLLFAILGNVLHSQTISKLPIYQGDMLIEEMPSGRIIFIYQDPEYKYIIENISFTTDNKKEALFLISEALRLINMDPTDESQHITHYVSGIKLIRYGFNQKAIYISKKEERGIASYEENLMLYKDALERYEYELDINKE